MSKFFERLFEYNYDDPSLEFGVHYYRDSRAHLDRETGNLHLDYFGQRIAEVHKDFSVVLCRPESGNAPGITKRWEYLIGSLVQNTATRARLSVSSRKLKTAAGLEETTVYIDYNIYDLGEKRWKRIASLNQAFRERARVSLNAVGGLQIERLDKRLDVTKDNKKYRDFTSKLRKLKAVLVAQAKMGVNLDLLKGSSYSQDTPVAKLVLGHCKAENRYYLSLDDQKDALYKLIMDWVEKDPSVEPLRLIAALCSYRRSSNKDGVEDLTRRVTNALREMQVEFLRRECITISEPSNSSEKLNDESHDQDGVLLPTPRLREVQVPCEAEVC